MAPVSPGDAVSDLWRFIEEPGTRFGTGWSIDETCGQVGTGELALVIARSGSGKSTWFLNIIANTPKVPTLVMNMEMQPRIQALWLTAMTFPMTAWAREMEDIMRAGPEDARWHEVHNALAEFPEVYPNLHFVMPNRPNVADIPIILDDIADATGVRPKRVFIDHMKFLAGSERGFDGYTQISSKTKEVAMESDCAIYLLQQTKRGEGQGEPNDGHLPVKFGSGMYGGEEDADWMFGLFRPERDPRFRKTPEQVGYEKWAELGIQRAAVKDQLRCQVIKNRVFSELQEDGIVLHYNPQSRKLTEGK
jgi:hypothetical protein